MEVKVVLRPKDVVTEGMNEFLNKELEKLFIPKGVDKDGILVKVSINSSNRLEKISVVVDYKNSKKNLSMFRVEKEGEFYSDMGSIIKTINKKVKRAYDIASSKRVASHRLDSAIDSNEFGFIEVVKHKKINADSISVDDAISKMENLGYDFYLFLNNEEFDIPSVIYKRDGGGYGCLEI